METFAQSAKNTKKKWLNPILRLPESVINKIAAGEVVERPSSIIKELMENALDAEATSVEVFLRRGGLEEIRVLDNGIGMTKEDLPLSIMRHATSKIKNETDLDQIQSFGFRGEALSAISRVCRFTLITRTKHSTEGYCLTLEGTNKPVIKATGTPIGTEVVAKDLFFNIPARKKFMRSVQTEWGHAQESFIRMALIKERGEFKLFHNEKKVFVISSTTHLKGRIRELLHFQGPLLELGSRFSASDTPIASLQGPEIYGVISPADNLYGNRERYFLYVNGRFIRDRMLNHAISAAYRELTHQSYPLVVLNILLSPKEVDVNVHPSKTEVRFQKPQAIYQWLTNLIRKRLANEKKPSEQSFSSRIEQAIQDFYHTPTYERPRSFYRAITQVKEKHPQPYMANPLFQKKQFSNLSVIGQWRNSYLICEDPKDAQGLILIDQHAAHERIGYERLKKAYKNGNLTTQILLIPEQMEVSALEYALIEEYQDFLKKLALDIELFGGKTLTIRSIPFLLKKVNIQNLVKAIIQDLNDFGQSQALENQIDRFLMTFSCHTMIRANHRLENEEIKTLLNQMDEVDFSTKCPHGRPVFIEFQLNEIEKRFLRTS